MAKPPEALDPSIWHPELLAGPLRSKRLTVLFGAPGALRDGMVRRGLMPLLRQPMPLARGRQRRNQVPIRFDGWGPLPLQALRTRIDAEFSAAWPHGSPDTLSAHLRAIGRLHHATVLLVLDAFERHLGERADRHDIERFDVELSECISHDAVPVHVLMVVDELENRALQRYTRWIADFGDHLLRLPSLLSDTAETSAWRDTDILGPPDSADEQAMGADDDADWPVDVSLDLTLADVNANPPAAAPAAAPAVPSVPPAAPPSVPSVAPPSVPSVAPHDSPAAPSMPPAAVAEPPIAAPEPVSFSAFEATPFDVTHDVHDDAPPLTGPAGTRPTNTGTLHTSDGAARHDGRGSVPTARIEPVFFADPSPPPPPAPEPAPSSTPAASVPTSSAIPRAASRPPPAAPASPFGAWPPVGPPPAPPAAAQAARSVPPWLSETDLEQMRRAQERAPRWPALLGLAVYMTLLFAGAWWVARWIIDSQRVETRPRPLDTPPAATAPPAASRAPVVPAPSPAAPQGAPPAAPTTAAAATSPRMLTLALPPDAGAAAPVVDELIQRVAAPAGLDLRAPAGAASALLGLMRTDALLAARAANAPPLQVVAPLYNEQIQVLVRTDARWDYVREIKGLRLNIGRADGARARTARALYQQMFGSPLAAAQANELDLDAALLALQQRGGPIDAVIVVSDVPIETQLQPALQRQVRELSIDARHMSMLTSLPAFSISRRTPQDRARLSATTYLVAAGAPPRPQDAALRTLAAALCRAQPALQAQGSPLLRGLRQGQQPDVGWPYVLPRAGNATCPQP